MKNYLLLFRTKTKIEFSAADIAALKLHLPENTKPVFFGADSGALAFRSTRPASNIIFELEGGDMSRKGPLSRFTDFALIEIGRDWRVKHGFGPFNSWLNRHASKDAA